MNCKLKYLVGLKITVSEAYEKYFVSDWKDKILSSIRKNQGYICEKPDKNTLLIHSGGIPERADAVLKDFIYRLKDITSSNPLYMSLIVDTDDKEKDDIFTDGMSIMYTYVDAITECFGCD